MPIVTVNDVSYYDETAGQSVTDKAQPLVLLHGFTGSVDNWHGPVHLFARARSTITVDLLGHGQTAAPADPVRYRIEQSAADLVELLAVIAPGPVNLLGYSMGGRLALYIAVTYPHLINKLILESASPGLADPAARAARVRSDEALADRIEREGVGAFVEYWEALPLFASQQALPDSTRQRLRDQRLQNRPYGLANSLRGMGTGVQPALWDQLGALTSPTLLLTGALDPKFCEIAQQMATRLPLATHITVPHAGHTIHLEQPQVYDEAIRAFLA